MKDLPYDGHLPFRALPSPFSHPAGTGDSVMGPRFL